jgi:lipopolysaccharide/colanic/teichoic acid biosynthesis glycosyltransferase
MSCVTLRAFALVTRFISAFYGTREKRVPRASFYHRYGKRALDLALTTPALIVLSPVLLLIALSVRLTLGAPILFRQMRPGLYGKPFTLYKFRTMTDARDAQGNLLPDAERLTALGHFLRRFKLDELPQLLNVLRGDMSIVGPRPGLLSQLAEYDANARKRLLVRPGLTGLAQINGNTYLSWSERWQYDTEYVDHLSFRLDAWIIWRTFAVILRGEGKFVRFPDYTQNVRR